MKATRSRHRWVVWLLIFSCCGLSWCVFAHESSSWICALRCGLWLKHVGKRDESPLMPLFEGWTDIGGLMSADGSVMVQNLSSVSFCRGDEMWVQRNETKKNIQHNVLVIYIYYNSCKGWGEWYQCMHPIPTFGPGPPLDLVREVQGNCCEGPWKVVPWFGLRSREGPEKVQRRSREGPGMALDLPWTFPWTLFSRTDAPEPIFGADGLQSGASPFALHGVRVALKAPVCVLRIWV